jgi:hypothetical protein
MFRVKSRKIFLLENCLFPNRYILTFILKTEREGFEPSLSFPKQTFQVCALNHSAISPDATRYYSTMELDKPQSYFGGNPKIN